MILSRIFCFVQVETHTQFEKTQESHGERVISFDTQDSKDASWHLAMTADKYRIMSILREQEVNNQNTPCNMYCTDCKKNSQEKEQIAQAKAAMLPTMQQNTQPQYNVSLTLCEYMLLKHNPRTHRTTHTHSHMSHTNHSRSRSHTPMSVHLSCSRTTLPCHTYNPRLRPRMETMTLHTR